MNGREQDREQSVGPETVEAEANTRERERGERGREVARSLDAFREELGKTRALHTDVRSMLDAELKIAPDQKLRKEGNSLLGKIRASIDRQIEATALIILAFGSLIKGPESTHAAKWVAEREGDNIEEVEKFLKEDAQSVEEAIDSLAAEFQKEQEQQSKIQEARFAAAKTKNEEMQHREGELAEELIDFVHEAGTVQELEEAYTALMEGEDVLEMRMQDRLLEEAKKLEATDPEAASKLYGLFPDEAMDFAVRRGDQAEIYDQTMEQFAEGTLDREGESKNYKVASLIERMDHDPRYLQNLKQLDNEQRSVLTDLMTDYIAILVKEVEAIPDPTTGEAEAEQDALYRLIEQIKSYRDALQ